ncbi:pentapeptide repeat-containing protein [Bradyrhizobium nanningense]|uniref:pentapeptide repeat-containing protein n=1 Tax=Bradyrhizobium nanningense TaxID=1325118 RepID=UPI0013E8E3C3|nr:pentapeptide repeat-containing protein [Bradyrhizobium nanningense]
MPNYPTLGRREYLIAAFGAGLIVLTFLVFVLAEWVGRHECPGCEPNETAKAISDARTALLQIIVGVAGVAALYFTWQTYLLGREGRASDNFIKAIDQLGNQAVHARVGGIVGLGRLLRTASAEGDYWPLMDVLTALVRQSVPVTDTPRGTKPSEDIQAAITVLARRSYSEIPGRTHDSPVDLSQCDLSYLWMAGGHYEWGYFGDSVLRNADFRKAFLKQTNLDRTDISDAQFDQATMPDALLRWIKKAQAASFKDADLTGADFEGSDLKGSSFQRAIVCGANFSKALLEPGQLDEARGDPTTKLPPGFPYPPTWQKSPR